MDLTSNVIINLITTFIEYLFLTLCQALSYILYIHYLFNLLNNHMKPVLFMFQIYILAKRFRKVV